MWVWLGPGFSNLVLFSFASGVISVGGRVDGTLFVNFGAGSKGLMVEGLAGGGLERLLLVRNGQTNAKIQTRKL